MTQIIKRSVDVIPNTPDSRESLHFYSIPDCAGPLLYWAYPNALLSSRQIFQSFASMYVPFFQVVVGLVQRCGALKSREGFDVGIGKQFYEEFQIGSVLLNDLVSVFKYL